METSRREFFKVMVAAVAIPYIPFGQLFKEQPKKQLNMHIDSIAIRQFRDQLLLLSAQKNSKLRRFA